jgi:PhnB protein
MSGVPDGFHTITPQLHVSNGDKAIALYKKALGAKVEVRMLAPGTNSIMHACLQIGGSKMFLSDWNPPGSKPHGTSSSVFLYVPNVDASHKKAVAAGMTEVMPPTDMFWGDRMSGVTDTFGHSWNLATFKRVVTPAEIKKAMAEQFGGTGAKKKPGKKSGSKR